MSYHTLLADLGITPNYIGFQQAITAAQLAKEDPSSLLLVTKTLYPAVARQHTSTAKAVERNIRFIVELAWERNPDLLRRIAGYPLSNKPKAAQFIAMLATHDPG